MVLSKAILSRPNASGGIFHPAGTLRQMCVGARRRAAREAPFDLAASARHATALSSNSNSHERSVSQVARAVLDALADWYWLRPVCAAITRIERP